MKNAVIVLSIIALIGLIVSSITNFGITIKNKKIKLYWAFPLIVGLIFIIFGFIPFDTFTDGLLSNNGMNPIKILILFLSMTGLSIFLDEMGLFSFLACKVVQRSKSSQIKMYFALCGLIAILTMFTSNDIVILTFTPFIIFFCKRTKCNPIPYLVSEFIIANTWSMMFIIGNPTNIYLASYFGINFIDYFLVMAIPTLCAGIVEIGILFLIFRKQLLKEFEYSNEEVKLKNLPLTIVGITILAICTILLVVSSYVDFLEMYIVSVGSFFLLIVICLIYFLCKKQRPIELGNAFKRLPYELIPFLLGMFTVSLCFNYYGISASLCSIFGYEYTNIIYGFSSLLACNLVNNIPMSVLFSGIISNMGSNLTVLPIYSSIIGSNLGAFITPLGALAGIMWIEILSSHEVKYTFLDFVKYGVIVGIPTAIVALLTLPLFI
ncbi:MAG: hypothetical protein K6E21_05095 [Bacilli bacterium]|nr:hypothetical protein [Bacilli bacterium]